MKIGIITFWQSQDNYGQLLQCFALQEYLKAQGHNAFLIKYDFTNRINKSTKHSWKQVLKKILIYPHLKEIYSHKKNNAEIEVLKNKNRQRAFDDFRNKYITQSDNIYKSLKELQENPPQAECYITGSDQVWAQLINNKENRVFFLDFGSSQIKKISYAASFARTDYPQELHCELKALLERFNAVSVREQEGIDICKSINYNKVSLVLDPTLLLNENIYNTYIDKNNPYAGKYAFIYSINISSPEEFRWKELRSYIVSKTLQTVVTPASGVVLGKELFKKVNYSYATIENWLSNIYYAQFVVTTSFHGVVFSIILKKNFIYIPLNGVFKRGNNRVFSFLNYLNLSNKIAFDNNTINEAIENTINWEETDQKLARLRKSSETFLINALK